MVDFNNISRDTELLLRRESLKSPEERDPKYAKATEDFIKFRGDQRTEREQSRNVFARAASNFLPDLATESRAFVGLITNPIRTLKGIGAISEGLISKLIPGEQQSEQNVDQLKKYLKDQYGSAEAIKERFATNPVGFAADLSLFLTGAGAGLRVAGATGKATDIISRAGRITDPTRIITEPISQTARLAGRAGSEVLGVTTGIKKEAIDLLADPSAGDLARAAMRGKIPDSRIVRFAERQFGVLKKRRKKKFEDSTAAIDLKQTKLTKAEIDEIVKSVADYRASQGRKILKNEATDKILKKINTKVMNPLKESDGTLEDLVELRQGMDDFAPKDFGTPEAAAFSAIRDKLRTKIAEKNPRYAEIFEEYAKDSRIIDAVKQELKVGTAAARSTVLTKLDNTLRRGDDIAQEILEELPNSQVLREMLAGRRANPLIAQDFLRGVAVGGVGAGVGGLDTAVGGFSLVSPRIVGEGASAIGAARRAIDAPRFTGRFTGRLPLVGGASPREIAAGTRTGLLAQRPVSAFLQDQEQQEQEQQRGLLR
tara:strand:- start:14178 stop:15803 length:1626 start_codon:yes stop_codon:yes gene_type:complete